jgi:Fur family transcriptional regulator, ferric uptake regulator
MLSPARLLNNRKLRATVARLDVLGLFAAHARLAPKDIYRLLDRADRTTSLATIHRVLAELCDAGLIEKHFLGTGTASYSLHQAGACAHLVCQRCGNVQTCTAAELQPLLSQLSEASGFALQESTVSLRGTCADCAQRLRRSREAG